MLCFTLMFSIDLIVILCILRSFIIKYVHLVTCGGGGVLICVRLLSTWCRIQLSMVNGEFFLEDASDTGKLTYEKCCF